MEQFVNKVAESGIITFDLAPYVPAEDECVAFDMKPYLFREMILREKDFRAALPTIAWDDYKGKHVALFCSVDAIIPVWAYMLIASNLQPIAASLYFGTVEEMKKSLVATRLQAIDIAEFADKRVVIKGCGDIAIPEIAYTTMTYRLRSVAKSIMYGEPCSTVPIYKRPAGA